MRKIVSLLLSVSMILSSTAWADDEYENYENFDPIEYSYQETDVEYFPLTETGNFGNYYRQAPPKEEEPCQKSGMCYYNCSRASCMTVGVAIGAAMIITMVAIIFQDGISAHSCH